MARISFKNVGIKADVAKRDVLQRNRSQLPIGIKTPLELCEDDLFVTHKNIKDQVRDNIRNLLLTNWGERVALYDFGANLRPLLTEYTNKEDFDSEAMLRINTAVSKWMPFVAPIGFESFPDFEDNEFLGKIKIIFAYSVPQLQIEEDVLELELFII